MADRGLGVLRLGPRKRRRPALACEECRRRKVKCDRGAPCDTCIKTKHPHCTYAPLLPSSADVRINREPLPLLPAQPTATAPTEALSASSFAAVVPGAADKNDFGSWVPICIEPPEVPGEKSSITTEGSISRGPGTEETTESHRSGPSSITSAHSHYLEERVRQLEQQLASVMLKEPEKVGREKPQGPWVEIKDGSIQKTRYFGQSHWLNGNFHGSRGLIDRMVGFKDHIESGAAGFADLKTKLAELKALGREIKRRREPAPSGITSVGRHMPPRELADSLVEAYLRTFEKVHRMLHVPTFRAAYENYWRNPAGTDEATVALIQMCMVIGATIYDERFSLRPQALQWMYEAIFWLVGPATHDKKKMTLTGLQIQCLLHFARQTTGVSADLSWISAGSLVRTAMYMGMHRDPSLLVRRMPLLKAELRRRLWATILEILLQSSIDAGGPPLISTDDYNTRPPADISDAQLLELANEDEAQASFGGGGGAEMAVPLALIETFATRLAVVRHINRIGTGPRPYDETLKLDAALGKAVRTITRRVTDSAGAAGGGRSSTSPSSGFQTRYARLLMLRMYTTLHYPILRSALRSPVFYYSRKVLLDTSLKIVSLCIPDSQLPRAGSTPSTMAEGTGRTQGLSSTLGGLMTADNCSSSVDLPGSHEGNADFFRLCLNGSGVLRTLQTQAFFITVMEVECRAHEKAQARDGGDDADGCGEAYDGDNDEDTARLKGVLATSTAFMRQRILSGETHAKGVAFGNCVVTNTRVAPGRDEDAFNASLVASLTSSVDETYALLVERAGFEEAVARLRAPDVSSRTDVGHGEANTALGFGAGSLAMPADAFALPGGVFDPTAPALSSMPTLMSGLSDLDMLQDFDDDMEIFRGWDWQDMAADPEFGMEFG